MVIIISRQVYRWIMWSFAVLTLLILWRGPAILKVLAPPRRVIVMIDPGHGGVDGGCQGGALQEKNVNLRIALALKEYLSKAGILTDVTRDEDYALEPFGRPGRHRRDLSKRVCLIEGSGAVVFASIHCDWSSDPTRYGPSVFYRYKKESSQRLAQLVQGELNKLVGIACREEPGDYYILRTPRTSGILVEAGFLSNPADCGRLNDPRYISAVADAIGCGIILYLRPTVSKSTAVAFGHLK